jgi:hypothetical protein
MQYSKNTNQEPPKLSEIKDYNDKKGLGFAEGGVRRRGNSSVVNAAARLHGIGTSSSPCLPDSVLRKVSETIHLKREIDRRRESFRQPLMELKTLEKTFEKNSSELNEYMHAAAITRLSSTEGDIVLEEKTGRKKLNKAARMDRMLRIAQTHQVSDAGDMVKKIMNIASDKMAKSVVVIKTATGE